MAETQFHLYTLQGPKRKRAEVACSCCHSKKVKCDLQSRSWQGHTACSSCASSGKECRPRPSKRDKFRRVAIPDDRDHSLIVPTTTARNGVSSRGVDQIVLDAADCYCPPPQPPPPPTTSVSQNQIPIPSDNHEEAVCRPQASLSITGSVSATQTPSQSRDVDYPYPLHNPPLVSRVSEDRLSKGHVGDPGFLIVYQPENESDARNQTESARKESSSPHFSPDLQQSFTETYFQFCYPWCPVLDKESLSKELTQSSLLDNALALVGSHIQPPMLPHTGPASNYERARKLFYDDEEADLLTSLKSVLLFYWWSPRSPAIVHRHSSWWWTSVVIRHAQQAGFHTESAVDRAGPAKFDLSLRRRIWWTAFARERLTAICQGRPCIIDPEDCNIPEPTLDDFPGVEDKSKAEVFIHWVRLCAIIGRIAKYLSRSSSNTSPTAFPVHLGKELIQWVKSLPAHLQLPINSSHTATFNRDVHQLHLPYLTMITVLHLTWSPHSLPNASSPAILAATCVARILKDILVRGGTRFLMAITCWYCGTAFIALLQASRTDELRQGAEEDLDILTLAIKQLKTMWGTANVFDQGFQRLRTSGKTFNDGSPGDVINPVPDEPQYLGNAHEPRMPDHHDDSSIDWLEYFPFVTAQTSAVAEKLLAQSSTNVFFRPEDVAEGWLLQNQNWFEEFESFTDSTFFSG